MCVEIVNRSVVNMVANVSYITRPKGVINTFLDEMDGIVSACS